MAHMPVNSSTREAGGKNIKHLYVSILRYIKTLSQNKQWLECSSLVLVRYTEDTELDSYNLEKKNVSWFRDVASSSIMSLSSNYPQ